MSQTYYEFLGIQATATQTEIESAWSKRYEHWRQLVTHHDPQRAEEANRALRTLEEIRKTLCDPVQRANYDRSLGINAGRLVDPQARPTGTPPVPPGTTTTASVPPRIKTDAPASPDPFTCPKCKRNNPTTVHCCQNCGEMLVRQCPECGEMASLVVTGLCDKCGYPYDRAAQRAQLRKQIQDTAPKIERLEQDLLQARNVLLSSCSFIVLFIIGFSCVVLLPISLVIPPLFILFSDIFDEDTAFILSAFSGLLVTGITVVGFVILLVRIRQRKKHYVAKLENELTQNKTQYNESVRRYNSLAFRPTDKKLQEWEQSHGRDVDFPPNNSPSWHRV